FNSIQNAPISELSCYIMIFLQHCSKYNINNIENAPIMLFLIKKSKSSKEFTYILFWELNYFKTGINGHIYHKIEKIILENINEKLNKQILCQKDFIEYLINSFKKKYSTSLFLDIKKYIKNSSIYKQKIPK
ncbi:hypothetical protein, partial [Thioclava electrotropha]|uniref:hypothetical protein n=1 Tax=Thioclava electrotropha TaxID=1549850 RepID=UPI0023A853CD